MLEIHNDANPIRPETSVSKRVLIYLALAVTLSLVVVVIAWIEGNEETVDLRRLTHGKGSQTGNELRFREEAPKLPHGYRLREEGREFAARRSGEDVKKAEGKFQEAIDTFRKSRDQMGEASDLNDLGLLHTARHQYARRWRI